MGVLESLPERPLTEAEVAALNDAGALEMVVPVARDEAVRTDDGEPVTVCEGVVVVTEAWAKGLAYGDGWRVVESRSLADADDRTDALLACETAVEDALMPGERAT